MDMAFWSAWLTLAVSGGVGLAAAIWWVERRNRDAQDVFRRS